MNLPILFFLRSDDVLATFIIYFSKAIIKCDADIPGAKIVDIFFVHPEKSTVKPGLIAPLEWIIDSQGKTSPFFARLQKGH